MKRALLTAFLLLLLLCFCTAGRAENGLSEDFSSALMTLYGNGGGTVISAAECGFSGAAVIKTESGCFLTVLSREDDGWTVLFENHQAAGEGTKVYLDTDEMLILTDPFPWNDGNCDQYYFVRENEWVLSSVIRYEGTPDEWNAGTEYHASLSGGWLCTETVYTDQNDNILMRSPGMPLPDVLTEEEKSLAAFSGFEPPVCAIGYTTDDSMCISDDILRRLFSAAVRGGYSYADGYLDRDGLQFIADRPDGSRVLLCCEYTQDHVCRITESTPLPAGTMIGIENFVETLNLGGQQYGVRIGRSSDGTWGARGVLMKSGGYFELGPCFASEGVLWWNASPYIGTVPWKDITVMDWSLIPESMEEARALIDPSGWATPHNPDPKDRLHLRQAPDRGSRSLGKYYNGTPLLVISRGSEWTRVRIGNTEGYMMTKYLAFGDQINSLPSALTGKINVHPATEILWDGETVPVKITGYDVSRLLIIGVAGDEWYLVWDPYTGHFGRIRQTELWDGNG
ncbi:MAG: hypothetical protein CW338_00695 [Clostridiales bacterium]|nr:hypothetical protein [Clostridiales bacterium]